VISIHRRQLLRAGSFGALSLVGCTDSSTPAGSSVLARPRDVSRIVKGQAHKDGAGVKLHKALGGELQSLDPFLMLDEIRSDVPADYEKGFPRHPHRGFETVTYMLSGAMEHKDSVGNHGLLQAGSTQWMTAGRGILHSEMPRQKEGLLWGLQLWVNLPASLKMGAPRYQDMQPGSIPEVSVGGARVRVVAGSAGGERGPIDGIAVDPTMLDITIPANGVFEHPLVASHNAFLFVLSGILQAGPSRGDVRERELAVLGAGESALLTSSAGARVLLLSGQPIGEPIARRGPFVMNTEAELDQAVDDYRNGRLVEGS
jgi:redox-sensitive bicupin YhaK (pirin superfamily)